MFTKQDQLVLIRKEQAKKYADEQQKKMNEKFQLLLQQLDGLQQSIKKYRLPELESDLYSETRITDSYHTGVIELQAAFSEFFKLFSEIQLTLKEKNQQAVDVFDKDQLCHLLSILEVFNNGRALNDSDELGKIKEKSNVLFGGEELSEIFPQLARLTSSMSYVINHINDRDKLKREQDQLVLQTLHDTQYNLEQFNQNPHDYFQPIAISSPLEIEDLLFMIFSYLSPKDLVKIASINKQWANMANKDALWRVAENNLLQPQIKNKKEFSVFIQKISSTIPRPILQYILNGRASKEQLLNFVKLLLLNKEDRECAMVGEISEIDREDIGFHYWQEWPALISPITTALFCLNLVPRPDVLYRTKHYNKMRALSFLIDKNRKLLGIIALIEGILNFEEASSIYSYHVRHEHNTNRPYNYESKLEPLLTKSGLEVLKQFKEKKIPFAEIKELDCQILYYLTNSTDAFMAWKENLITFEETKIWGSDKCKFLLSESGLRVLRNQFIPREKLFSMSAKLLCMLFEWGGIKLIEEQLITLEQLEGQVEKLSLLSDKGLEWGAKSTKWATINLFKALSEKLITWEEVINMWDISKNLTHAKDLLCLLFTDNGLNLLRKKLITIEKVKKIHSLGEKADHILRELLDPGWFEIWSDSWQILTEKELENKNTISFPQQRFFVARSETILPRDDREEEDTLGPKG